MIKLHNRLGPSMKLITNGFKRVKILIIVCYN